MADYSTLKAELGKPAYAGLSNADAAAALKALTATKQVPRSMAESEMMALIGDQSFAAVMNHPTLALWKKDVDAGNLVGVGIWAGAWKRLGLITDAEATAVIAYVANPVTVPASPGELVGWPAPTEYDVAHARSLT